MPEQHPVAALVDRIVAGARITSRAEREDLRRELWTHFEEGGTSPDSITCAIRRFGDEAAVTEALRRVYCWDYLAWYLAKLVVSMVASAAAALAIVAVVNLRVELETEIWRLAPGFSRVAGLSIVVVLGVVAAWEAVRRPFSRSRALVAIAGYAAVCGLMPWLVAGSLGAFLVATLFVVLGYLCSRLGPPTLRWLMTFAAFALAEYGVHVALNVTLAPIRAAVAGAILVAVWSSTVWILRYVDHAFMDRFDEART